MDSYPYPIPSIWSVALQELLVTQHFVRYSTKYSYSKVSPGFFVSVFDQLFEGFPRRRGEGQDLRVLREGARGGPRPGPRGRGRARRLRRGRHGADALAANPVFAEMKALGEKKKFGVQQVRRRRRLPHARARGRRRPGGAGVARWARAGLQLKKVNGDLGHVQGAALQVGAAAKELQAEIFEREKRKTAEREAKKAEKAAAAEKKDE